MKVTVIGGGSSYTPELIVGFLKRTDSFPITELWLMDIAPRRLDIVGGFAQGMVTAAGNPFAVRLTTDQREAVCNASYSPERAALNTLGLNHLSWHRGFEV